MDIKREQLENSKATGHITVQVNKEPVIKHENVLFHHVGSEEIGGVLVADGIDGIVQVPYPANLGNGTHTKTYRADYHDSDFNLVYTYSDGAKHRAILGTVTVTFGGFFRTAEGTYSFTTQLGDEIRGEFKLAAY